MPISPCPPAAPLPRHDLRQNGETKAYTAPSWLRGGHLQTIYASTFLRVPRLDFVRSIWTSPDGDEIVVDRMRGKPGSPRLVLLHGMESGSHSHYARFMAWHCRDGGWDLLIPHFRSCGGVLNLKPRSYHAADTAELDWILARAATESEFSSLHVAGFSLGGNVLLKWLAMHRHLCRPELMSAAAVSVPLDYEGSIERTRRGLVRPYERHMVRRMRKKYQAKARATPGAIDLERVSRARGIEELDDWLTAPLHGFSSAREYWRAAGNLDDLRRITLPTLLVNARNDPCLTERSFPLASGVSPSLTLEFPEQGGHVGFVTGSFPGRFDWLPQRILRFFSSSTGDHADH